MTVKTVQRKLKTQRIKKMRSQRTEDDAWEAIRGLWEGHRIDPVAYQRKIREESDHIEV